MSQSEGLEFQPELIPRRGEVNAWLLSLAALIGIMLLNRALDFIPGWTWIFFGFLVFSALSISLGNWMDRKTRILLEPDGIRFENGIRRVRLSWLDIQKVAVLPARWGQSVQVLGEQAHFDFKTLGEVKYQGRVRGQVGFTDGKTILDVILREANLTLIEQSNNAYYYARI